MLTELVEDNLEGLLSEEALSFVQFSAGWCGNCRIMKPKFKKSSIEHKSVSFFLVDAEKFPLSRKLASVDNLPTFAAFKKGECVGQTQTNKADVLKTFIDEIASD
ncbi:MAG: thioredoxin family protein [Opitutales bacterium]|nr:thioredoxin family protein [Opitutales bacterium]